MSIADLEADFDVFEDIIEIDSRQIRSHYDAILRYF